MSKLFCPDLSLRDFVIEHKAAPVVDSLLKLNNRQLRLDLASRNKDSDDFFHLITLPLPSGAAFPHSANFDRLMSI